MKKITVKAILENLNTILDFVNIELESHGFPSNLVPDIDVAVEEVFVNICHYAYNSAGTSPADGEATLYISVGNEAVFKFIDTGIPFNPLEAPTPNLDTPLMERDIGGLGILLVRQIMDNITYEYTNNQNILTLTKKR